MRMEVLFERACLFVERMTALILEHRRAMRQETMVNMAMSAAMQATEARLQPAPMSYPVAQEAPSYAADPTGNDVLPRGFDDDYSKRIP